MLPLVSVIVPVYNVEKYLKQCIKSLISQTYQRLEILLIDDESNDSSGKICDKFAQKYKNIFSYHKKNTGLGLTRNYGLKLIKGEYVTFVDSDDYLGKNAIELLVKGLENNKNDTVIGGFTKISDQGHKLYIEKYISGIVNKSQVYNQLFIKMLGSAPAKHDAIRPSVWNTLYSTKIINKYNLTFVSERKLISEDIVWDSDYYKYSKSVKIIDSVDYFYRFNPNSLTQSYMKERFQKNIYFFEYMVDKMKKSPVYAEAKVRLSKNLFINIKLCISQERKIPFTLRRRHIRIICSNEHLKQAINEYPIYKLGLRQLSFIIMIKFNMVSILSILSGVGLI